MNIYDGDKAMYNHINTPYHLTNTVQTALFLACLLLSVLVPGAIHSASAADDQPSNTQPSAKTFYTFPIRYAADPNTPSKCQIGYFDFDGKTFYTWKGVLVEASVVPRQEEHRHVPLLDLGSLQAVPVDPPMTFAQVDKGHLAPGYYDHANRIFYRWKGISIPAASTQDTATVPARDIIDADKIKFSTVEIDVPAHLRDLAAKLK